MRSKNKLTLTDKSTWKERECSVVEHLQEHEFYPFSDCGELEQMRADIDALKNLVFTLTNFIEEKHGQDFVNKFLGK